LELVLELSVSRSETDDMHRHRMPQREEHLDTFRSAPGVFGGPAEAMALDVTKRVGAVLILTPVATRRALVFFTSRLTAISARLPRSLLRVLVSVRPLRCSALG
jgi:hypothetical protein